MAAYGVADVLQRLLDLSCTQVCGEPDSLHEPITLFGGHIRNDPAGELGIWDRHAVTGVPVLHDGCPPADFLHGVLLALELDQVTDEEGFLSKDRDAAEYVAHRILRRKCNRQAADAKSRKHRAHVVARVVQSDN